MATEAVSIADKITSLRVQVKEELASDSPDQARVDALLTEAESLREKQVAAEKSATEAKAARDANQARLAHLEELMGRSAEGDGYLPDSVEEAKEHIPNDGGAKRDSNYKPPNFIDGFAASVQPKAVREYMGDTLKEEESAERDAFTRWLMATNGKDFIDGTDEHTRNALKSLRSTGRMIDTTRASVGLSGAGAPNTGAGGGYAVPEGFLPDLAQGTPGTPGFKFRPRATVRTVANDHGNVPTFSGIPAGYIAENAKPDNIVPDWGQIDYRVSKQGGNMRFSVEMVRNSGLDIPTIVGQVATGATGRFEDREMMQGDFAGTPRHFEGLLSTNLAMPTHANEGATWALADLEEHFGEVPEEYADGAVWIMKRRKLAQLAALDRANANASVEVGITPTILGFPVITYEGDGLHAEAGATAGDDLGLFVNLAYYLLIDQVGSVIERDDSIYTEYDAVLFKFRRWGDGRGTKLLPEASASTTGTGALSNWGVRITKGSG